MIFKYFPDQETVDKAIQEDDPLLMLVSFDGKEVLVSNIDDSFEHHILLKNLNYSEMDIDKYFRIVLNRDGADWTFVCPSNYKGIAVKDTRIERFYNDGMGLIAKAIGALGYEPKIDIPRRYRRHFNML